MTEPKNNAIRSVWIIESEDSQRGRRIASDFYLSQAEATKKIESKFKYYQSRGGIDCIKRLEGNAGIGFWFVLHGQFCKYYLLRIDWADLGSFDLVDEANEGQKAKMGIL
jgi:hypothetical protein